jgi:hypothetical protein
MMQTHARQLPARQVPMEFLRSFQGVLMRLKALVLGGLFAAATALPAGATPISGQLNISGDVVVTLSAIDFAPPVGGGTGQFVIGTTSTGDFSFPFMTQGTAKDLSSAAQPVGTPFLLTSFLTLPNPANNIAFDLNFITPGSFSSAACGAPAAADQQCTPTLPPGLGLSPFELTNTAVFNPATGNTELHSSVVFNMAGQVRNVTTGELSNFTGTYSAQFLTPFQTVLAELAANGSVSNTYSGTFNATVVPTTTPEPASMALLGVGLLTAGWRRKKLNA